MTLAEALAELERLADPDNVAGMARLGIAPNRHAYGVRMPDVRRLARRIGRDRDLADSLWRAGSRETRILATLVDDPGKVTGRQMDEWAVQFDDWEICDQACMNLFWRTSHAFAKVGAWSVRDEEYVQRAAFALVAVLAWKDLEAPDERILEFLPIVERGASDARPIVRKAVDWALRQVGKRSAATHGPALALARKLEEDDEPNRARIGRTAAQELGSDAVRKRLGP